MVLISSNNTWSKYICKTGLLAQFWFLLIWNRIWGISTSRHDHRMTKNKTLLLIWLIYMIDSEGDTQNDAADRHEQNGLYNWTLNTKYMYLIWLLMKQCFKHLSWITRNDDLRQAYTIRCGELLNYQLVNCIQGFWFYFHLLESICETNDVVVKYAWRNCEQIYVKYIGILC